MSELHVGDQVGGYALLELVGEGGMGRVYRAVQPRLERIVALKVIRPEVASDEEFRERFRREMKLAASIDHPAVVPVYEADEVDGVLFAAMRWVAGPDLGQLLKTDGPLDPAQAMHILRRVSSALEAAHSLGLVHRDIKPANVLLEGDRVYLSDFGLARSTAPPDGDHRPGGRVGTVDYAAPELLDNGPPDPRSDVYGLGCVVYEMLTGSVPYPIESLLAKGHAHGQAELRPASQLRDELPQAIDQVLQTALAKRPADRYRTPEELTAATEKALRVGEARRVLARRWMPTRIKRPLLAAAGVAIAAVATAAIVFTIGSSGPSRPRRSSASSARTVLVGRHLPAAASLPACGHALLGPPRDCRNSGGGVSEITDVRDTLRMGTMDFTVTNVRVGKSLRDSTGATFSAPTGTRFIVIDATVTNRTSTPQVFESNSQTTSGRQTALWLFSHNGKVEPYHGAHSADYSVQYGIALATLRSPLSRAEIYPGLPFSGQLVFYYPEAQLRSGRRAILEIHEFGQDFGSVRLLGGVRLRL
jgi:hypothetical protein